ncbi:amidohydrolase family protein [Blastococcus atacamensis]|uniref:amidohydrolase family protein n=1 Tax=Blastococcus atacamensis TaxID=2070508 RepID=UPI000CEC7614|nr:amidohydrolase family protein [Blastococcus atacamensis]
MLKTIRGVHANAALVGPELRRLDDVWMTFSDGLITDVGQGRGPAGLDRVPGVLAPGLVDCHVHLAMSGSADVVAELSGLTPDGVGAAVLRNARAQVESGVTTVRDLGSPHDAVVGMAGELSAGAAVSPVVVAAGAISTPTGHGHFLARHAEGPAEYAAAVRAVAAGGARAVKLFATGGVITAGTTPGAPQMTPAELAAAVHEAHRHGLRVAAHAHGTEGILAALHAGVDSVEHFSYLDEEAMAVARTAGSWLVSTLVATARFVHAEDRGRATPETLAKILAHAPAEESSLHRAVSSGCRLAVGTDAGTTFNPHGGGMQEQALHLHRSGLTTTEVLRAMTVEGARLLHEPAGWLRPGRRADVLVLRGDPTQDLGHLSNPQGVITRGRLLTAGLAAQS